jgi:hypothetical protein
MQTQFKAMQQQMLPQKSPVITRGCGRPGSVPRVVVSNVVAKAAHNVSSQEVAFQSLPESKGPQVCKPWFFVRAPRPCTVMQHVRGRYAQHWGCSIIGLNSVGHPHNVAPLSPAAGPRL